MVVFGQVIGLARAGVAELDLDGGVADGELLAQRRLERRREIGVLRSLGATGARVAAVFWIEGVGCKYLVHGQRAA